MRVTPKTLIFVTAAACMAAAAIANTSWILGGISLLILFFTPIHVDEPAPGDSYYKCKIPDGYRIYQSNVTVAGIKHYPKAVVQLQKLSEPNIELRPNPSNKHDKNAIEVLLVNNDKKQQIGHLPREIAAIIAERGNPDLTARAKNLWVGDRGGMKLTIDILGPKQHFKDYFPKP